MDDEVTQIFKKWKLNNPLPKKDVENINSVNIANNETFDSRTFTRPAKRRTFTIPDTNTPPSLQTVNSEMQSMESGVSHLENFKRILKIQNFNGLFKKFKIFIDFFEIQNSKI